MKRKILLFLFLLSSFAMFGNDLKMLVPNGLPSIALSQMIQEKEMIGSHTISYLVPKSTDRVLVEMMRGEMDIAVVPSNLAAQLYQKRGDYKILGSITNSSFYLLSSQKIKDMKELEGKKIYMFARGLTPDIVLRTILKEQGILEKVKIEYLSTPNEVLQLLFQNPKDIAFLPEPVVSQALKKNADLQICFSMKKEWEKIFPKTSGFPQGVLIVKTDVIEDKALTEALIRAVEESIAFVSQSTERKTLLAKQGFDFQEAIWKNIFERANIAWTPISKEKENFKKYYDILEKENPKLIGGKVPKDSIYVE